MQTETSTLTNFKKEKPMNEETPGRVGKFDFGNVSPEETDLQEEKATALAKEWVDREP